MTTRASAEPGLLTIERSARRLKALRRASFASLVLLLIQYGLGMYTNIYVTVPSADKGGGLGKAISNGPAALSIHAVLAILLILAAIGLIVQAVMARYWTVLAAAAVGLITIIGAAFSGANFTNNGGQDSASMTMAVLAGVAMLCYGTVLYLLSSPRQP
jgi:ABC-type Co2+ transport system permease subunit